MLFSYGSGWQQINGNKKCRQIAGNFDRHGNAAVQSGVHRPMEHIQGFTRSHWMPKLVECLHRIAPAAAIAEKFEWNTQNTNKTQFLASNYGHTFRSLVVCENFNPKTDPLLSSLMWQASFKCETLQLELEISATFLATKRCQWTKFGKVIKLARSSLKNGCIYAPIGVKLLTSYPTCRSQIIGLLRGPFMPAATMLWFDSGSQRGGSHCMDPQTY